MQIFGFFFFHFYFYIFVISSMQLYISLFCVFVPPVINLEQLGFELHSQTNVLIQKPVNTFLSKVC